MPPALSSKSKPLAASVLLALTGCILWLAITPKLQQAKDQLVDQQEKDSRVFLPVVDDSLAHVVSSHRRVLYSILAEDHKIPELFPFELTDYLGFFATVAGLILAAGAGIGGGGLLVPIFILVFGFCIKHAIPLASVTVLGGAIANNLLNANKHHPNHPSRPAIDWDLIVQLEPMTIAGALIGAELNDSLPPTVLVILLFLLLSVTAYKTLTKAHKLHQQETQAFLKAQQEEVKLLANGGGYQNDNGNSNHHDGTDVENDSAANGNGTYGSVGNGNSNNNNDTKDIIDFRGQPSFGADKMRQAGYAAGQLTALFTVVTVLNLLKGGPGEAGGGPLGLEFCGDRCFWISEAVIFLIIFLFAAWIRRGILERVQSGGPILSEIEWDEENTIWYPLYAIVAGLVAGMFGVGGGIIKGPLMLALGVHPAVASATSACMILFTSSTATISYMIFGLLIYDYAGSCLLVGFLATLVGQTMMSMLMKKYNRNSYIAYAIGIVVGLSAIAMTAESVLALVR